MSNNGKRIESSISMRAVRQVSGVVGPLGEWDMALLAAKECASRLRQIADEYGSADLDAIADSYDRMADVVAAAAIG